MATALGGRCSGEIGADGGSLAPVALASPGEEGENWIMDGGEDGDVGASGSEGTPPEAPGGSTPAALDTPQLSHTSSPISAHFAVFGPVSTTGAGSARGAPKLSAS
mmetsp:Transcript_68421/g.182356  ORF Transcript_68421/g.182356 Transcript_68421/m.182356 type:complete len:106 (-) Transcript_68421:154-471(-)